MSVDGFAGLTAPSIAGIERLAAASFARLPAKFRNLCKDIVFRVEEFPDDDVLRDLGAESPFDILGLFQGIGMAHDQAVHETGRMPNIMFLYRRPMLDYWAESGETSGDIVTHVLVHEIGHHFGLSDEDMDRIEREAES